jgi:hypothetical protein
LVKRKGEEFERYNDDDDDDNTATASKCRLCKQFDKTVEHIVSESPTLAKNNT